MALNAQIQSLAPELNSATIRVVQGLTGQGTATVVGANRTVPFAAGKFSDVPWRPARCISALSTWQR